MYLRVFCSVHLKTNETNTTGLYGQNEKQVAYGVTDQAQTM